jgi:hypothetical protein
MNISKGDAITYAALVVTAALQAADSFRKESAMPPESHPILSSEIWSYLPVVLLTLVAIIWIIKLTSKPRPSTNIHSSFDPEMKVKQIVNQHYLNITVPLDGFEYVNCKFENVTFVYEGKGPSGMTRPIIPAGTTLAFGSHDIPIRYAIQIMNFLNSNSERAEIKMLPEMKH